MYLCGTSRTENLQWTDVILYNTYICIGKDVQGLNIDLMISLKLD